MNSECYLRAESETLLIHGYEVFRQTHCIRCKQKLQSRPFEVSLGNGNSEKNDRERWLLQTVYQFAKVFVFCQQYSVLAIRKIENCLVTRAAILLDNIADVMTLFAQQGDKKGVTTLVSEQIHVAC
jgi:hypothetical protein